MDNWYKPIKLYAQYSRDYVGVKKKELKELEEKYTDIISDLMLFYSHERHPNINDIIKKHTGKTWEELQ